MKTKSKKILLFIILFIELIGIFSFDIYKYNVNRKEYNVFLNGDLRLKVIEYTDKVYPGDVGYLKLQGEPNTDYKLTVKYYSGYSKADGVGTKTSNSKGIVSWRWRIGSRTSSGDFKIYISNNRQTGFVNLSVLSKQNDDNKLDILSFVINIVLILLISVTAICLVETYNENSIIISLLILLIAAIIGVVTLFSVIFAVYKLIQILPQYFLKILNIIVIVLVHVIIILPLVFIVILCVLYGRKGKK